MLDARADSAVREAVQNHLREAAALTTSRRATGSFESRSSRYRLNDGTLVESSDMAMIGAELVGFLSEDDPPRVRSTWEPGSRAVLVHVGKGNQIVLTSRTKNGALVWSAPVRDTLRSGSGLSQDGSPISQRNFHDAEAFLLRPSTPPAPRTSSVPPPLPQPKRTSSVPPPPPYRATRPLPPDPVPPPEKRKSIPPPLPARAHLKSLPPTDAPRPPPHMPPRRVSPPPLPNVIPPPPPRSRDWDELAGLVPDGGRPSVPAAPASTDDLAVTTPRGSAWTPPAPVSSPFPLVNPTNG